MRLTVLLATGLVLSTPAMAAKGLEVNVYSARKEALIKPLLDRFTRQSGIQVNLVTGKADTLLKRLEIEGRNSPADLLITTDAGRLHRAKLLGVIQPIESEALNTAVPANFRDPQSYWFGLSLRARPIMYVTARVKPSELSSYESLAEPIWKGRICIRSSNNIYNQSLVASMIVASGVEETERWARGLVANLARKPQGGDRDQIRAAAAGQCDVAIANTYYLAKMLNSKKDSHQIQAAKQVAVFWPNQTDRGVHVNISGAAVTTAARHKALAIKLLEFMLTKKSQRWYAEVNFEYPVREGIRVHPSLENWGSFKSDNINLSLLGENNAAAVKLMDRAGWR